MTHPAWAAGPESIRLRLAASSHPRPVREAAFAVLDRIQGFLPEHQLDGIFNLGVAMAEAIGLDPHDMVIRARRMLPEVEGPYTQQLQAARDYAAGELKR